MNSFLLYIYMEKDGRTPFDLTYGHNRTQKRAGQEKNVSGRKKPETSGYKLSRLSDLDLHRIGILCKVDRLISVDLAFVEEVADCFVHGDHTHSLVGLHYTHDLV